MSEQAQKVKNKNIPEWAQGLYYNSGLIKLDFSHSRRVANRIG
jgi:hypothetical protein